MLKHTKRKKKKRISRICIITAVLCLTVLYPTSGNISLASDSATHRICDVYITLGSRYQDGIQWHRTNYLTRHQAVQDAEFLVYTGMGLESYDIEISGDNVELLSDSHIELPAGEEDEMTYFSVQFRAKDTGYGELRIDAMGYEPLTGLEGYSDTRCVEIYAYEEGDFFNYDSESTDIQPYACVQYSEREGFLSAEEAKAWINKLNSMSLQDLAETFSLNESGVNAIQEWREMQAQEPVEMDCVLPENPVQDTGMNCIRYVPPVTYIILIIAIAAVILIIFFWRRRKRN